MKVRDVMTAHPILVRADEPAAELRRLMRAGAVRHLPVVEGDRVLGVWVSTEAGSLVMLPADHVGRADVDADAGDAMAALMGDAEVVLAWSDENPVGVLTRADALAIVRAAMARGTGRRHRRPTVMRIAGPAGAGKTTLIVRTLALLDRVDAAVVQANCAAPGDGEAIGDAPVIEEPGAGRPAGLSRAVDLLADRQLILVEDRDGPLDLSRGLGEDLQVGVVPAADADALPAERLTDAQAIVLTRGDELAEERLAEIAAGLAARRPGLPVFPVAPARDDRGLAEWVRWVQAQALRRHG
ncbi:MAG: CBS domain-containing protein [Thermoleophilia bacterium]